jgi:hypothetical protein
LVDLALRIGNAVQLQLAGISAEMDYFRDRYWQNGAATTRAADLRLDKYRPHVQKIAYDFLNGSEQDPAAVLAGLLLVIYRLRNNMFHGPKWAYGIQGQCDNFNNGIAVLKWVLSLRN